MTDLETLTAAVQAWIEIDPDLDNRHELRGLVELASSDDDARVELSDRFNGRLAFGTSGIRGPLGGGPNRMNRVVLRRMVAGIMAVVGPGQRILIGRDARSKSDLLARDAAEVVAAYGGHALLLPGHGPTPFVSFGVPHLGADLGLMVTASHNPPVDNGCKVFLSDGAQLRAPLDGQIESAIEEIEPFGPDIAVQVEGGSITQLGDDVATAYRSAIAGTFGSAGPMNVAYTPLHGVGAETLLAVFDQAGMAPPTVELTQHHPDPLFPTVAFPNPEEDGALDLVTDLAQRIRADLVVANDPDADRLSVTVPVGGGWRTLTGDEVGALLADHLLSRTSLENGVVVSTVVCSDLVNRIAQAAGAEAQQTLTGFKWIAGAAFAEPERFVFCYEESLGYAVSPLVHDKDGISAALVFVNMAAELEARGATVLGRLAELAVEHGLHTTHAVSVRFDGPGAVAKAGAVVQDLRDNLPQEIAGRQVLSSFDFAPGETLPPTNLLRFDLEGNVRLMLRPSGTEAKTKLYFEKVQPVASTDQVAQARLDALDELRTLADILAAQLTS